MKRGQETQSIMLCEISELKKKDGEDKGMIEEDKNITGKQTWGKVIR